MNAEFELLVCTNGNEYCLPGLSYGLQVAGLLHRPVTLLAALGNQPEAVVHAQVEEIVKQIEGLGISYQYVERVADMVEAIEAQASLGKYWSIYSTPTRNLLYRLLRQSTFTRLMAETETPIIRLREGRWPVRHILACSGGLQSTQALEEVVNTLALASHAKITWLHVVEPDTDIYHSLEHEEDFPDALTPHARALRLALQRARAAGIEADMHVRQGVAVHEILAEVESGNYDIVGMGSSYSFATSAASLRHAFIPNITAQIAEDVDIPLLCVRAGIGKE
jgi:nucleotide-binding universal stress UspA family protein